MTTVPSTTDMQAWAEHIETDERLDAPADRLAQMLPSWLVTGRGREVLAGTWLGHSLHPLLTDFPLGFWASASLLDLVGGARSAAAARRLVGVGVLTALPTAAAGLSDWSRLQGGSRRVGLVHGGLNGAALLFYGASYLARRRSRARGALYGLLGGAVATASGYLGGHLSLTRAVTRDNRLLQPVPEPVPAPPAAAGDPAGGPSAARPADLRR